MPKRPRSHTLEDLSRGRLREAFEREGWTVEDLAKDYGEDLFVRIFENGQSTPYSFLVQAKATDDLSRFLRKRSVDIKFPVERGHAAHWIRFAEPVFLTVWDATADTTFWVCVQDALEDSVLCKERNSKRVRQNSSMQVVVPTINTLDSAGLKRMRGITKLRFSRASREQEGVEILKEALARLGASVEEYEPDQGLVVIRYPDDEVWAYCLGDMALLLDQLSKGMKLPKGDVISEALRFFAAGVSSGRTDKPALRQLKIEDSISRQFYGAKLR